ncbi:pld1 [Symbiodinium pilosum]|uniref:Pld1 protein n=1 Tax=Symbiodinium pilosum TaxID=2952 RepID=A0A812XAM8_SYMPI|nr:pld1 [Symbiodinium pilosum]
MPCSGGKRKQGTVAHFSFHPLNSLQVPISALILGTAPLGCGWAGDVSEGEAEATILQALSLGIRYLDTAPWYGAGLCEQRIGKALAAAHSTTKEQVVLATKVGRFMVTKPESAAYGTRVDKGYDFNTDAYHDNIPVWDYRKEGVEESFRQSRQRLQRHFIECVRVHDAEDDERWEEACGSDGAVSTLVSLRSRGEIGEVSLGFNKAEYLMKTVLKFPVGTFDNIMIAGRWNLLDQSAYPLMLECQKRGIKVQLAAVFCAGLLWGQGFYFYRSSVPQEAAEKVKRWEELAKSFNLSLPAVALAFAYLPSCVERIAVGCASAEQVRSNAQLCDVEVPLELWQKAKADGLLPSFLSL